MFSEARPPVLPNIALAFCCLVLLFALLSVTVGLKECDVMLTLKGPISDN